MEGEDFRLVNLAIRHAVVSGSCRLMARVEPRASAGLLKAALLHSRKSASVLDAMCAKARDAADTAPGRRRLLG